MAEMIGKKYKEKILVDTSIFPNITEMTPKELSYIPVGAKGDKPSFAIIMTDIFQGKSAIGQFSFETLKSALNEVGFDISPKIDVNACKICGGELKPSKALMNPLCGVSEWSDGDIDGATLSFSSDAVIVDCQKCENCGHSFTFSY